MSAPEKTNRAPTVKTHPSDQDFQCSRCQQNIPDIKSVFYAYYPEPFRILCPPCLLALGVTATNVHGRWTPCDFCGKLQRIIFDYNLSHNFSDRDFANICIDCGTLSHLPFRFIRDGLWNAETQKKDAPPDLPSTVRRLLTQIALFLRNTTKSPKP